MFSAKLGCLVLRLPTLRSRADEIPSLASLCLSRLNLELGKQLSGFDPNAIQQLCRYDWPNNYTQFQGVLCELAALTSSPYIRGRTVAELLTRERCLNRGASPPPPDPGRQEQTLEEIARAAVRQAVAAHGGNQTAAARQLGISRTTLWRYLRQDSQADAGGT